MSTYNIRKFIAAFGAQRMTTEKSKADIQRFAMKISDAKAHELFQGYIDAASSQESREKLIAIRKRDES